MTRMVVVLALVVAACIGGQSSDDSVDQVAGGMYTAAVEYLDSTVGLSESDLVYVVEPSLSEWITYCGTTDSPDVESAAALGEPCEVFWSIEDNPRFDFTPSAMAEIEEALSPASVTFVSDRVDALEHRNGIPPHPVKDGAELISLGVALEVDGNIYLPIAKQGEGVLVVAVLTDSGWVIDGVMHWVA